MKTQRLTNILKAALGPLVPSNYAPDMSNDKRHLNLIFSGTLSSHDLSEPSKTLFDKTKSHISIWI